MTVRVGFFGAGLIATYHSKMLRRSGQDVVWAGVHDPDRTRADQFARATGAVVCDREEAVLDGCDAVYVCTWTSEHARLVAAAVERGKPVFCEKPLAVDLATATAMTETVEAAGLANQVGLVLRSSPAFNWARHLVEDQRSGRVMSVVFRDDQYLPVQGMYGSTWRGDPLLAGSGTLLEHSIHDVDMIEFVCGPMESVSARTAEFHGIVGIEDVVATSFGLAGGGVSRPDLRRLLGRDDRVDHLAAVGPPGRHLTEQHGGRL